MMSPPWGEGPEPPLAARRVPPFCTQRRRRDAGGEGSDAAGTRDFAAQVQRRHGPQGDRAKSWDRGVDGATDRVARGRGGSFLAAAGRADGCGARGEALRRGRHEAGLKTPCRARLGARPPRAQAQARHAVDPVGGIHRAAPGGLSLQPVLRSLPPLGRQALADDAPVACGRREALRGLRRRHGAGDRRPADRRSP
jgi:hypothetical protein